jgi:acyl transferase domain-containing protein
VIGDRIEAAALKETFCQDRTNGQKLYVGSVKGNVGHTENVAGLAGLIKAILVLEHGLIPPQATFVNPSKETPLDSWGIEVRVSLLHLCRTLLSIF